MTVVDFGAGGVDVTAADAAAVDAAATVTTTSA